MPVEFEFEVDKGFHFADHFGKRFNMPVSHNRVYLPDDLGNGFIQEVSLNGMSLCLHRYTLKQELVLKRLASSAGNMVALKFDCRGVAGNSDRNIDSLFAGTKGSEVEFGTGNFLTRITIQPDQEVVFLVISMSRQALSELLHLEPGINPVAYMLKENQSFLLHENITQEMVRTLKQLGQINQTDQLATLSYQTKAQELIYFLFTKLLSRTPGSSVALNQVDVDKIYKVRDDILNDLSIPPYLPQLAVSAGMSQSKMKQLFTQVFGKSIYNYYQAERMEEAARLLKLYSVSETGYKIGFSNLSHFSRLFEKHYQLKPKRFKHTLVSGNI